MRTFATLSVLILILSGSIFAQGTAGESAKYEYRYLVDMPTAGILEKGFVGVSNDILPEGVLISTIEVGVFTNISFGISYGGSNIIGRGPVDWYELPGINFRVRLLNESVLIPAVTLGFDSQGKGIYFDEEDRFAIKSPGFFGAVSKNFALMGYLSLHGVVNYSLETKDGDNFLNVQIGAEKTLSPNFSLVLEYDLAFNDNSTNRFGEGNGYLNMAIKWAVGDGFTIGLEIRDLLENKEWSPHAADRGLNIEYIQSIF